MIAKEGILVFDDEEKKLEVPIEEISVIIVDPPRSGLHASAIETLIDLKKTYPEVTLCYISCNPDTLARDLELLVSVYSIQKIQPIDMFPHTHHIENVVALG
jgi:23S rRNA (uracil1939-C5)-methyltransferase